MIKLSNKNYKYVELIENLATKLKNGFYKSRSNICLVLVNFCYNNALQTYLRYEKTLYRRLLFLNYKQNLQKV